MNAYLTTLVQEEKSNKFLLNDGRLGPSSSPLGILTEEGSCQPQVGEAAAFEKPPFEPHIFSLACLLNLLLGFG